MRKTVSLAALALAFAPMALAHSVTKLAQSAQQEVVITSEDLGSGVHMLTGQGGNIGLLTGDDGAFVIDSQFARIAEKNLDKIRELSGGAPTFLVNTHWHGDHSGGNGEFGATIIAHENVRRRLSTRETLSLLGRENVSEPTEPASWPVITFDDDLKLHLNGQTISVFHTPDAHTDTDAMVYFEEADILHMGDVFFNGSFPFIDTSSGGTVAGYLAAMKMAHDQTSDDTKIIPGHGALATRADLANSIAMLEGVQLAVGQAVAQGMSADDAVRANVLAEWAEAWGGGGINADVFTRLVHADPARVATETPRPKRSGGGGS